MWKDEKEGMLNHRSEDQYLFNNSELFQDKSELPPEWSELAPIGRIGSLGLRITRLGWSTIGRLSLSSSSIASRVILLVRSY